MTYATNRPNNSPNEITVNSINFDGHARIPNTSSNIIAIAISINPIPKYFLALLSIDILIYLYENKINNRNVHVVHNGGGPFVGRDSRCYEQNIQKKPHFISFLKRWL